MSATVEAIGMAAGTMTTVSFVPQVWRVWLTRSARDISMPMYVIFTTGVAAWFAYGCLLGAWPVILANGVTFVLAGCVIGMKLRFDRQNRHPTAI